MCKLKVYNREFTSSEQEYQWHFATHIGVNLIANEKVSAQTPSEAKEIASCITRHLHKDWHIIKHCCAKFKHEILNSNGQRIVDSTRDLY